MSEASQVFLEKMVIHQVGNKLREEGITVSAGLYQFQDDESVKEILLKYFLTPFSSDLFYQFCHETDLNLNELYVYISKIFSEPECLYEQSINIAKHLYEKSAHPKIKGGELYVIYLTNCTMNDQTTDAIGIFKTENKDVYLRVTQNQQAEMEINYEEGINIKRLDKGCLIYNVNGGSGYRISVVDPGTKDEGEALYWKDEFLKVTNVVDEHYMTKSYLDLCDNFCKEIYGEVHNVDKKEQMVFMNDSLNYFAKNTRFDADDYAKEVIKEPKLIEEFKSYQQDYELTNSLDTGGDFDISRNAVKSVKRKFKSQIKLDSEIEIKLKNIDPDGCLQYIERGFDQNKKMNYYKVYFNSEE